MKRLSAIGLCIFGVFFFSNVSAQASSSVEYMAHVKNIGWMDWVKDGQTAGTTGRGLNMEAIKINIKNLPPNAHITYQAHVPRFAWQDWVKDGQIAGTTGQGAWIEAMKIRLENYSGWSAVYRVHVAGYGWMNWVNEGQIAGTTGQGRAIEAIEVKLQNTGSSVNPGTLK